jgi:ribosomal-protein-alanine N-acetyltransferase
MRIERKTMTGRLITPRLQLVEADVALLSASLEGAAALATQLAATVPADWPPEHVDEGALRWTLAAIEAGRAPSPWGFYFMLLRDPASTVIGTCGFKGPPDAQGSVEVGYSVVPFAQRRGYATEAVQALIACAFERGARSVAAETLPHLTASIGVMDKCGMNLSQTASEPGVLRRVRLRAD